MSAGEPSTAPSTARGAAMADSAGEKPSTPASEAVRFLTPGLCNRTVHPSIPRRSPRPSWPGRVGVCAGTGRPVRQPVHVEGNCAADTRRKPGRVPRDSSGSTPYIYSGYREGTAVPGYESLEYPEGRQPEDCNLQGSIENPGSCVEWISNQGLFARLVGQRSHSTISLVGPVPQ